MKYLFTAFLFLCCLHTGMAQPFIIKGSVKDTLNQASLPMASVVLINTKDSAITTYTRTDTNGNFSLSVDKNGKYVVRITFPSFADYTEVINTNKEVTDLGLIAMVSKEHVLKEFVLTKQISAIKIKGDTTEYIADSFKVKDNANVEALLKKLPGIQVDKNGQITAQGETVQKILVDGEEFFSDDPKVVTQNLQANVVDKVQVYDKKSDQAEFTGVDDGQKTKTINLQLKEDKKKGFFGKIDAGGGTDGYFQNQDMINAFRGKRQISAFFITSNTDKVGLGWQDNNKYGSTETITDDDGNTYSIPGGTDDGMTNWSGSYTGEGFPKVWTGGAHYADKWNENKNHIVANYRYGKQQVESNGNTTTQYLLSKDTSNVSYMDKAQFSTGERHAVDLSYELKIDSNNTIEISASAGHKNGMSLSTFRTITSQHTEGGDDTLYVNNRNITSDGSSDFINSHLLFKRKFAKKGRTLSIDVKENYKDAKSNGHLTSTFTPGTGNVSTDQAKINNSTTLAFSGKAIYTEPLTKVLNLELDYSAVINNTTTKNNSLNYDSSDQKYDLVDSLFSSNYKYNIFSNIGGVFLRWNYKKLNFSVGSSVANAHYIQSDLMYPDRSREYNYINLFPTANFRYKVNNQRSFYFDYSGNTQQPTITQIQPLTQNTDPTNIVEGNPNLKQAFNHRFTLSGNDYKVLTSRWLHAYVSFRYTDNAISRSQQNVEGINKTQYINVNGNYGASVWAGAGFKLKKPELRIGFHIDPSINHTVSYVNGQKNENDNNTYEGGLDFSIDKEDKYDFSFSPNFSYTDNKATISANNSNYWTSNTSFSGSVELPKNFEISTEINFMFRQRTEAFPTNNNVIKWNAFVSKKFFKKKQLEVRLNVFDILNQNLGYDRTAQGNIITQNNYNTIRRYGMLNVIWNFTHQPGGGASEAEDDD